MALVARDTFNRADNAASLGSLDTGQTWTTQNGTCGILNQHEYQPVSTAFPGNLATFDSGIADGILQLTIGNPSFANGSNCGLIFRYVDLNNYWRLAVNHIDAPAIVLQKNVAGTITTLVNQSEGFFQGDIIEVDLNGSTITVVYNGLTVATVTDTFNDTATHHGLYAVADTAWYLDNITLYDLAGPPHALGTFPAKLTTTQADTTGPVLALDTGQTVLMGHGNLGITSGQLYNQALWEGSYALADLGSGDVTISVTLRAGSLVAGGNAGSLFRYQDILHRWGIFFNNNGNVELDKYNGGNNPNPSYPGPAWTVGDVLTVKANGDHIVADLNGTVFADVIDSDFSAATRHGPVVTANRQGGNGTLAWRISDWIATLGGMVYALARGGTTYVGMRQQPPWRKRL